MKRSAYILLGGILAAALLLAGCTGAAAPTRYYARFVPDADGIVALTLESRYAAVLSVYGAVYGYFGKDERIASLDMDSINERIEELEESVSLYASYLELVDHNILITQMNIEYNNLKYDELSEKYGDDPSLSEQVELDLLVSQNERLEMTEQAYETEKEKDQGLYDENAALLAELRALPEYVPAPENGFLLSLDYNAPSDADTLTLGTFVPARDVMLEADMQDAGLTPGQVVNVKLNNRWVEMKVFKIESKVFLKLTDKSINEASSVVDFMQPCMIEVDG